MRSPGQRVVTAEGHGKDGKVASYSFALSFHLGPNAESSRWLEDGMSVYAVKTLHELVHNPYFQANAITLGGIASGMEPFLQALNDDA